MECEKHFIENVKRNEGGRYIVALPFKSNRNQIEELHRQALRCFSALEQRLSADPTLSAYQDRMNKYIKLGHMTKIDANNKAIEFYLPYHPVIKQSSQTTKVRVVFDRSAKSSTGISVNETLMVGSHNTRRYHFFSSSFQTTQVRYDRRHREDVPPIS